MIYEKGLFFHFFCLTQCLYGCCEVISFKKEPESTIIPTFDMKQSSKLTKYVNKHVKSLIEGVRLMRKPSQDTFAGVLNQI
jgi:hypothetical protein